MNNELAIVKACVLQQSSKATNRFRHSLFMMRNSFFLAHKYPFNHRVFLLTTLLVLLVYLLTLAPDLTWANFGGDGGELIAAAVTLGVPHPPGYPTYTVLGKLVSLLPLGTVAWRFNLFSAICVALAAGVVAVISIQDSVTGKSLAAHRLRLAAHPFPLAGHLLAFTPLVWGQALIAEVYGLNLLLVALVLWALGGQRPLPKHKFAFTGLLLGLSLTTHLTSVLLLPLALSLTPRAKWGKLGVGLLVGLTPFLLLPLLAQGNSPVVWGDPTTMRGWWWLVSGHIYHANAFALPPDQWQSRLAEWALLLVAGGVVGGLGAAGYKLQAGKNGRALLLTFWLYVIYAFFYNTPDAAVLLLPAVLILALLLAPILWRLGLWGWLLPFALLLLNFNAQNLRHEEQVRPFATTALEGAPTHAILLTPGNETIFTLWYFQAVEGMRPDVILVDENLFAFDWYRARLQAQHPDLRHLANDDLGGFQRENGPLRPILRVNLWTFYQPDLGNRSP